VYDLAPAPGLVILGGEDVPFSNNGPISGITHNPGSTDILIETSGVYEVNYSVELISGIGSSLSIAVNGVVDPSTIFIPIVAIGEITGIQLLELVAGDVLTLRNDSTVSFTLSAEPGVGARIVLIRISDLLV